MKSKATLIAVAAASLLSFHAFALAQEAPPSTPPEASASASASTTKQVPKLAVSWDCGTCEPNAKVAPLIEQSYAEQAAARGYGVSSSESAEVVIKEYRQRNPAVRALFGVFSGKDKLSTKLTFRGKEYTAEDYSANAIQGMNSLCESVAQQTAAHVIAALKE